MRHAWPVSDDDVRLLETLVTEWLPLPDVAERLDTDITRVRRLLQDHALVAVRRGSPTVLSVPADLLPGNELMPDLPGTISVLVDSGYDEAGALRWLLTPDDSLPGTPLSRLIAGHKTEIRRRAQALAF
jgi:Rv2175c C-terminal domain of unknown function